MGGIELFGATSRVPLRLEGRQHASNFIEADAVRSFVRSGIRRRFDAGAGHYTRNDLGNVAHTIVVRGSAHVESLIEDHLFRCVERGNECTGYVLDVRDGPPGSSIRL